MSGNLPGKAPRRRLSTPTCECLMTVVQAVALHFVCAREVKGGKRGAEQILSVSCSFWSRSKSSALSDALRNMAGSWPRNTTSRLPLARKRPKHTGASEFAFACWFFGLPFDVDKSKRFGTTPPPSLRHHRCDNHDDRYDHGDDQGVAQPFYNMFDKFEGSRCGRLLLPKRRLAAY